MWSSTQRRRARSLMRSMSLVLSRQMHFPEFAGGNIIHQFPHRGIVVRPPASPAPR